MVRGDFRNRPLLISKGLKTAKMLKTPPINIMKNISLFFLGIALLLTTISVSAQSKAEKERSTFISNSKRLEKNPFDPNAEAARAAGFKWVTDTDQVTVGMCGAVMLLIPQKKNKFKSELLMQFTLGMAVFKLENADRKEDEKAAQLAGVESMLRTYEVMVTENEKARNTELDALVAKQKSGGLKAVVDAAFDSGKCEVKGSKI